MKMRFLCLAGLIMAAMAGQVQAGAILVFSTGVDNSGNLLNAGDTDSHYSIDAGSGPVVVSQSTVTSPDHQWVSNTLDSQWITSFTGVNGPDTNYSTTFSLAGLLANTAVITGNVAADDGTMIFLNGTQVFDDHFTGFNSPWDHFTNFTINSNFVDGLNTLTFFTPDNGGGPGGLQVEFTSATADVGTAVPEPSSIALLGIGAIGIAFARRKRKQQTLAE